jgi:hypothetical protein
VNVCSGIRADGGRCKVQAMRNSEWCINHHADRSELRRRRASKGGKRGGRGGIRISAWQLLPAIRDLYSRLPETYHLEPWELQWMLYALNYTDELEDEGEIAAAVEVARGDWLHWRAA